MAGRGNAVLVQYASLAPPSLERRAGIERGGPLWLDTIYHQPVTFSDASRWGSVLNIVVASSVVGTRPQGASFSTAPGTTWQTHQILTFNGVA